MKSIIRISSGWWLHKSLLAQTDDHAGGPVPDIEKIVEIGIVRGYSLGTGSAIGAGTYL